MKPNFQKILVILASISLALSACGTAELTLEASQPTQASAEQAAPSPTEVGSEGEATESAAGATLSIAPSESEARFIINEVLLGRDKTVVGATNDVTGSLNPDFDNPSQTTVGTFAVDLSTLATDDNNRTRQVRNNILETNIEEFQFAVFETTAIAGLPEVINFGEPFSFQLTGDLTIHGVTLEKTFEVTATAVSETRIEALASLPITYPEFNVRILRLPQQVASVEEELILEIEFTAEAG